MHIYIFSTFLSVLFSILSINTNNIYIKTYKGKIRLGQIFAIISSFPLIFISAIRYGVGQDYFYTYVPYFKKLLIDSNNENIEFGFYYLTKFIQLFTDNYIWLFVVCSIIYFTFIFKAIYENSENPPLSIFLLIGTSYYFVFLNTMRQMLAISIFLYAIKYIKKRNFIKYIIYIMIATSLHTAALTFLPVYFLYGIKVKPAKGILIIIGSVLVIYKLYPLIITLLQYTKFGNYIGSSFDTGRNGYVMLLIQISILIFAWIYMNKNDKEEDKEYNFYLVLQMIAVIVASLEGVVPLLTRITWNFGIISIILIPLSISKEKNAKLRVILIFIVTVLFSTYILYTVGIKNSNNVLPYRTIFTREIIK